MIFLKLYWFIRSNTFHLLNITYMYKSAFSSLRWRQALLHWRKQWSAFSFSKIQDLIYPIRSKRFSIFSSIKGTSLENFEPYGETGIKTLVKIATAFGIRQGDRVCELGCGRALVSFWLWSSLSCKIIGIDRIDIFIKNGNTIARKLQTKEISFFHRDLVSSEEDALFDWDQYDWVYLYGVGLSEDFFQKLTQKFQNKEKTFLISVGVDLREFSPQWFIKNWVWGSFPWGWTKVYQFQWKENLNEPIALTED